MSCSLYIATIIKMKSVPFQYIKQTCRCNIELRQTDCIADSRKIYIYKTGQTRKRKEVISIIKTAQIFEFLMQLARHLTTCGAATIVISLYIPTHGRGRSKPIVFKFYRYNGESPKSRKEPNIYLLTASAYVWAQMVGRLKRPKSTLKRQLTIKAAKYQTRKHMNRTIRTVKKHMK